MKFIRSIVLALAATLALSAAVVAVQPADLHCPAGDTFGKVEAAEEGALNGFVPQLGRTFCIKAGPGNTGILVGDGERTLIEYLEDLGFVNPGGQVPDVSYYVLDYPEPPTSPVPSVAPTPSPESSVVPTPSPELSVTPVPQPTLPPTDMNWNKDPDITNEELPIALGVLGMALYLLWREKRDLEARSRAIEAKNKRRG